MNYQNEFDNLNTMMLEDFPLRPDEVQSADPVEFRERCADIIVKAQERLTFAGITQQERLGLMRIASKGLECMRYNSHEALQDFYLNCYSVEINKATESEYMVAQDFSYVVDENKEVIIHEQEIKEGIDQFSAFDPAFNHPSFSANNGMGSLAEVEGFVSKNKNMLILGALLLGGTYLFMKKKA